MTTKLSTREKVMVVILLVLSVGLAYFKLFYEPTQAEISRLKLKASNETSAAAALAPKVTKINQMNAYILEAEASGQKQQIPYYNNSKEVMSTLKTILDKTTSYELSFGDIKRDDYILLRTISISYQVPTYAESRAIVDALGDCGLINQVSNVSMTNYESISYVTVKQGKKTITQMVDNSYYTTKLSITFFELDPEV